MSYYAFESTAPLEIRTFRSKSRVLRYRVVHLAPEVDAELFASGRYAAFIRGGRARFDGEVLEHRVQLAWQPAPGRTHYAMLSPALLRALKLEVGDEVMVRFNLVDPEEVEVPEVLAAALRRSANHRRRFEALTPGQRRAQGAFITAVKSAAAQADRVARVLQALELGEPVGPPKRRAPSRARRSG